MTTLREELAKADMYPERDNAYLVHVSDVDTIEAAIRAEEAAKSAAEIERLRGNLSALKAGVELLRESMGREAEEFAALSRDHADLRKRADALRDAAVKVDVLMSCDAERQAVGALHAARAAYDAAAPTPEPEDDPLAGIPKAESIADCVRAAVNGWKAPADGTPMSPADALDRLGVEVFGKVPEVLEEYLAPTDDEPINPLATYKRLDDHERRLGRLERDVIDHYEHLSGLVDKGSNNRGDLVLRADDASERLNQLTESNNSLLDNQQIHASAIAELTERIRITTSMVQGLLDGDADRIAKMEHRLDEVGQRAQFAVDMHHGQGSVIGELRGKVERLTEAVEVSQELTGERLTALEAAPAWQVVTDAMIDAYLDGARETPLHSVDSWREGCRNGIRAALAVQASGEGQ